MKTIASFTVNHDKLEKGMYVSRIDGDVITYDIRMKKPNGGDYLSNGALHTFEHLFATCARNSAWADQVLYVGPIRDFEGVIPGSRRWECGNYQEHDLPGAKAVAQDMLAVLADWTPEKMRYTE